MTTLHVTPSPHAGSGGSRLLRWAPRILALLFVAFLTIFSLDVFGVGYSPWETILAFTMHNLPGLILLACIALAWRRPWVGGISFLAFAAWYVTAMPGFDWITYLLLAGIPSLIALLYAADWLARRHNRE